MKNITAMTRLIFKFNVKPWATILFGLILALLFVQSSQAAGRSGFPVGRTLMEPRALALAGANVSDTGWLGGAFWNPASAAGSERGLHSSFARHTLDLWSGNFGFSAPWHENLVSGMYLSRFDYGELDYTERNVGATGETFTAAENLFGAFIAGEFAEQFTWGLTLKYFWGALEEENASATAIDLGFTYDVGWEMFRFGGAVRNLGAEMNSYGEEKNPLPTEVVIGGSKKLEHLPLTLHAAATLGATGDQEIDLEWFPGSPSFGFGAGGEFEIAPEGLKDPFYIRLGYHSRGQNLQLGQRLDILSGVTFGAGTMVGKVGVDYTFAPMSGFGDVHRMGMKVVL